jgi:hypothetical protein
MNNKKWIEEKVMESSDCNTRTGEKSGHGKKKIPFIDSSRPIMRIFIDQLVFIRTYKLV